LPDQVAETVQKQRSRALHDLAAQQKQSFMLSQLGRSAEVLWEGQTQSLDNGMTRYFGYTPNYLRVACDHSATDDLCNQIRTVELLAMQGDVLIGRLLN
jgi:threonylcarbamoyladenosine tRNA methylthiotransferase MtaB